MKKQSFHSLSKQQRRQAQAVEVLACLILLPVISGRTMLYLYRSVTRSVQGALMFVLQAGMACHPPVIAQNGEGTAHE